MATKDNWGQRTLLFFQHATEIVGGDGEGLIVLTDSNKLRQIVIPVDRNVVEWFKQSRQDTKGRERRLPDILVKVLDAEQIVLEVDIDNIVNGTYQALLTNSQTLDQYPIDVEDAIMLNKISNGNIPLYIDDGLFMRQSSAYDEKMKGVSMPINILSDSMLKRALKDSVEKENYEQAAEIQNEMKKRGL